MLGYVRINGSLEYEYETANVIGGDLYINLDMDYQEAESAFQGAEKIELLTEQGGTVVGNYPSVRYISTAYGGGATQEEFEIMGSTAKDMAMVRLHVLTAMEQTLEKILKVQLEHDMAIAELYGGGY